MQDKGCRKEETTEKVFGGKKDMQANIFFIIPEGSNQKTNKKQSR